MKACDVCAAFGKVVAGTDPETSLLPHATHLCPRHAEDYRAALEWATRMFLSFAGRPPNVEAIPQLKQLSPRRPE